MVGRIIPPLFSGCGLMFSTSSYCDRMGITFVSDSSMIPDSRVLRRHLDEAVKKVEQYLLEKEKSKPVRKVNRRG